jgi:hypothetical protein
MVMVLLVCILVGFSTFHRRSSYSHEMEEIPLTKLSFRYFPFLFRIGCYDQFLIAFLVCFQRLTASLCGP